MSLIKTVQLPLLLLTLAWINIAVESKVGEISNEKLLYDIEGYVFPPEYFSSKKKDEWLKDTVVHIKGGQYTGFVKYVLKTIKSTFLINFFYYMLIF